MTPLLKPSQVASGSSSSFPEVNLKKEEDLELLAKTNDKERAFWNSTFNKAKVIQSKQADAITEMRELEVERYKDQGYNLEIDDTMKGTAKMQELQRSIDDGDSKKAKKSQKELIIGQVLVYPSFRPQLKEVSSWEEIDKQPQLLDKLAKYYHNAYKLQRYFNDYINHTVEDDEDPKLVYQFIKQVEIHAAVTEINKQITGLSEVGIVRIDINNDDFAAVYAPEQGDEAINLEDVDDDLEDDDESMSDMSLDGNEFHKDLTSEIKEVQPAPQEIFNFNQQLAAPLAEFLVGNPIDMDAFNRALDELTSWCDANNIQEERDNWIVSWTKITTLQQLRGEAMRCYNAILADVTNIQEQDNYKKARASAVHMWCTVLNLLENLVDNIVPSESKVELAISEELAKRAAPPLNSPVLPPSTAAKTTSKKRDRHASSKLKAPPAEPTIESRMSIECAPGIVQEYVRGKLETKTIIGYRKVGRFGHQLLLKGFGKTPDRFQYELVAAKKFGDALEDYKDAGGKKMAIEDRLYTSGKRLAHAEFYGVASVRREGSREWRNEAVTYVYLRWPGLSFVWISESELSKRWGKTQIRSRIQQYRDEAGQKMPKRPTIRVSTGRKKDYIYNDEDSGYESAEEPNRNRRRDYKSHSDNKNRRRDDPVYDDTDDEGPSESVDTDEEDGEDDQSSDEENEDEGVADLEDFIMKSPTREERLEQMLADLQQKFEALEELQQKVLNEQNTPKEQNAHEGQKGQKGHKGRKGQKGKGHASGR